MKMDNTGQTGQANDAPWFSYTAYIYIFTIIFIIHRSSYLLQVPVAALIVVLRPRTIMLCCILITTL